MMVPIYFLLYMIKLMPIQLRESDKHGEVLKKKRMYFLKSYTKLSVCSDIIFILLNITL